jgi:hypothetical protein
MDFKATTNQWPLCKGAEICIQRLDYDGGQHVTIQLGDIFPIFVSTDAANLRASAKVVARYNEQVVIVELNDGSKWRLNRQQRLGSFEIGAGTSASLWEVEGPAKNSPVAA